MHQRAVTLWCDGRSEWGVVRVCVWWPAVHGRLLLFSCLALLLLSSHQRRTQGFWRCFFLLDSLDSSLRRSEQRGSPAIGPCGFSCGILVDSFRVGGPLDSVPPPQTTMPTTTTTAQPQTISPFSDSPTTGRFLRFPIRHPPAKSRRGAAACVEEHAQPHAARVGHDGRLEHAAGAVSASSAALAASRERGDEAEAQERREADEAARVHLRPQDHVLAQDRETVLELLPRALSRTPAAAADRWARTAAAVGLVRSCGGGLASRAVGADHREAHDLE